VCTFSYFSGSAHSAYKIEVQLKTNENTEFLEDSISLGGHLRHRRLQLGLYQKEVAERLGVASSTIWKWENGWTVDLRFIPRVIKFLGYNPIPCPDDVMESWLGTNRSQRADLGTTGC
jgi:DNA-binding XRE family transcriptional regulator